MRTKATNERLRNEIQYKRKETIEFFGGQCEICGFSNKNILEIHHLLPLSKSGDNNWDNLSVLCPNCHRSIHDVLNSKKPKESLKTYYEYYIMHLEEFLSVLSRSNEALIKQNETEMKVLDIKINYLEKEIVRKEAESSDIKEKLLKNEMKLAGHDHYEQKGA